MAYIEKPVLEFARQNHISLFRDAQSDLTLIPSFGMFDETGSIEQLVTESGAYYMFYKINYCDTKNVIQAERAIALLLPGDRTELAYWTKRGGSKILDVHRGRGNIIIGDPEEGKTQVYPFDSTNVSELILSPGCFYTIQADPESREPLVVSGFYAPPQDLNAIEISLHPGQKTVKSPEGIIRVPSDFMAACGVGPQE